MNSHLTQRVTRAVGATRRLLAACGLALLGGAAQADAVATLERFVQGVQGGRAAFTQTIVPPQQAGERESAPPARERRSTGRFAFLRPDRFRFEYDKPFEQTIVADGQRVWLYDPDLRQASSRPMDEALGATPAALLAGGELQRDFELSAQPSRDGLQWARATPRAREGAFQWIDVGFRDGMLAAVEILDGFGQRTVLRFERLQTDPLPDARDFRFVPPPGVDVIEQ